jgi:repressor LexA
MLYYAKGNISMSKNFEAKQQELLNYIYEFTKQNGYTPSLREMCAKMNFASTSSVFYYLQKCEDQGLIRRSKGKNRAIELVGEAYGNTVPVVGKVAAGEPIFAEQNIEEYLQLPQNMFDNSCGDLFALTIRGNSMIEAGINSGDKVIVRRQNVANNGDIVVALIDESATVKRFYKENNYYRLQPENSTMQPIILDSVIVLGIVVGLIRKY